MHHPQPEDASSGQHSGDAELFDLARIKPRGPRNAFITNLSSNGG
jgi:hypothetical protein